MDYVLAGVAAATAAGLLLIVLWGRSRRPRTTIRALVSSIVSINALCVLACLVVVGLSLAGPPPVLAQEGAPGATEGTSAVALGAALATGLACIGAGIAVGIAGAAAIGGITERPEMLGRTLIFVGLAEGIAIYGLIISFLILSG